MVISLRSKGSQEKGTEKRIVARYHDDIPREVGLQTTETERLKAEGKKTLKGRHS